MSRFTCRRAPSDLAGPGAARPVFVRSRRGLDHILTRLTSVRYTTAMCDVCGEEGGCGPPWCPSRRSARCRSYLLLWQLLLRCCFRCGGLTGIVMLRRRVRVGQADGDGTWKTVGDHLV